MKTLGTILLVWGYLSMIGWIYAIPNSLGLASNDPLVCFPTLIGIFYAPIAMVVTGHWLRRRAKKQANEKID